MTDKGKRRKDSKRRQQHTAMVEAYRELRNVYGGGRTPDGVLKAFRAEMESLYGWCLSEGALQQAFWRLSRPRPSKKQHNAILTIEQEAAVVAEYKELLSKNVGSTPPKAIRNALRERINARHGVKLTRSTFLGILKRHGVRIEQQSLLTPEQQSMALEWLAEMRKNGMRYSGGYPALLARIRDAFGVEMKEVTLKGIVARHDREKRERGE